MIAGEWRACEFGFSVGVLVFAVAWKLTTKPARKVWCTTYV
jgi:hypothetical protein